MLRILMIKDIRRWWSDRNAVITTLILPLLLTAILGFSFGGFGGGRAISAIPLAVVGDYPPQIQEYITRSLGETELFNVSWVDSSAAHRMIGEGEVSAALLLPNDLVSEYFSGRHVDVGLWKDPTSLLKADIIGQILQRMLLNLNAGEAVYQSVWPADWYPDAADPGADDPIGDLFGSSPTFLDVYRQIRSESPGARAAWDRLQKIMDHQVELTDALSAPVVRVDVVDRSGQMTRSEEEQAASTNAFDYILPGMAIFFLMFAASAAGNDLHRERQAGTMRRLLSAPLGGGTLVIGKWVYAMVNGLLQLVVLLAAGRILFRVHLGVDLVSIPLVSLLTSAALASFFLPLALLTRNEKQMGQISTGLVLLMAILGGNFMSLDAMPAFMLNFSRLTPNYWANRAFSQIIVHRRNVLDVLPEILVLCLFTVVFLSVALVLLKRRGGREALL